MTARFDTPLDEGRDVDLTVTIQDVAGDPVTAAAATYALYAYGDMTAWLTKTLGSGIAQAAGLFTITLTDTELDSRSGYHYHEMRVTDGAGALYTVFRGRVRFEKSRI